MKSPKYLDPTIANFCSILSPFISRTGISPCEEFSYTVTLYFPSLVLNEKKWDLNENNLLQLLQMEDHIRCVEIDCRLDCFKISIPTCFHKFYKLSSSWPLSPNSQKMSLDLFILTLISHPLHFSPPWGPEFMFKFLNRGNRGKLVVLINVRE